MAYNTKPIVADKDNNPISQYYNPATDSYEPVEGQSGANKVVLYNADGTENNELSLLPILDKLSQLTGSVIDENTRKANEVTRQSNEVDRESNEDIRVANELLRIESEDERVDAEEDRQTTIENLKVWEEYNGSKTYHPLNKVTYQGSSYICIAESEGNLPTDIEYWLMIAEKGKDGDGTGDMLKSVYDTNDTGTVDNAERLGNKLPSEYALSGDIPSKVSELENDIGYITEEDIPDVDVSGKMDKSGGTFTGDVEHGFNIVNQPQLKGYRESYTSIEQETPQGVVTIDVRLGNIFNVFVSNTTTIDVLSSGIANGSSFTLVLQNDSTAQAITFSSNIQWGDDGIPDLTKPFGIYFITFIKISAYWYAFYGGEF